MLKPALSAVLLMTMAFAMPARALDEAEARAVMTRAVDGYIRPAYADFNAAASALAAETEALCGTPTTARLDAVKARFGETIEAWGRVDIIRDGPVLQANRLERVLFYPDRKSTGLKQVQAVLAKPDDSVTDARALAARSVAMQGLGAFEFVFFGDYPERVVAESGGFRCRYGLAIARNIATIAGELDAAWSDPGGIAADWKNPSPDSQTFRNGEEAMQALIGLHVHGIELVRDQRIKAFYRGRDQKTLPNAALFRRSGFTARAIAANVDGLGRLWQVSGMTTLLPARQRPAVGPILFDYKAAATAIRTLPQPTKQRLEDEAYLGRLDYIEFVLKDAMTRINADVGGAVGLEAGFSFADGD